MSDDYNGMNTCPPVCRRAHPRFIIEGTGEVRAKNDRLQPTIVKDVSVRGARIIANFPLDVNQEIAIDIQSGILPEPVVQKKARVRWVNKIDENLWSIGLDFDLDNIITF